MRRYTTKADPAAVRAHDRVQRDCAASGPNEKWVCDFASTPLHPPHRDAAGRRLLNFDGRSSRWTHASSLVRPPDVRRDTGAMPVRVTPVTAAADWSE